MTPGSFRPLCLLAALCVAPGAGYAQQPATAEPQANSPAAVADTDDTSAQPPAVLGAARAQAGGELEVYYVPDPNDPQRLLPVLGFDLEQLRQAWAAAKGLGAETAGPAFTLEELTLRGAAQGNAAEFDAQLRLTVDRRDWVRIPLRMPQALALAAPEYEGGGEFRCQYDPAQGWVAWVRSAPGAEHTVKWRLSVPLATVASGAALRLALPAATACSVQLKVPGQELAARSSGAAGQLTQSVTGATTQLELVGAHGEVDLRWGPRETADSVPAPLDVRQWLYVELDGERARLHNRLTVTRPGSPLSEFTVRLPAGVRWAPQFPTGFVVEAQPPDQEGRTRLVVRPEPPVTGPAQLELLAETTLTQPAADQPGKTLTVAPWEIVGAAAVTGFVAIDDARQWQVDVQRHLGLRPVDAGLLPLEFQRPGLSGALAIESAAFELAAVVSPRPAEVTVEPEYRLEVAAQETTLRGTLTYRLRGPNSPPLRLATHGWTVERFAAPGEEAAAPDADAVELVAPLPPAGDPPRDELVMELLARRETPADGQVDWSLPAPVGVESAPMTVGVVAAENVEWLPRDTAPQNWQPVASAAAEPNGAARSGLAWRSLRPHPPLEARVRVLPQQILVTALGRITLEAQAAQIEQLFDYLVRHEPVSELLLDVPADLATNSSLQLSVNGQSLPSTAWAIAAGDDPATPARLRVRLPAPRTGELQLAARYRAAIEPLAGDVTRRVDLPLCVAAQGGLETNRLTLGGKSNLRLQVDAAGPWQPSDDHRRGSAAGALRLTSDAAPQRVTFAATLDAAHPAARATVERAWVQTQYPGAGGQVRSAFRVLYEDRSLALAVPRSAVAATVEVRLDGQRTNHRTLPDGNVELTWPDETSTPHVVELRYETREPTPATGRFAVELPRLAVPAAVQRQYWQLLLPPHVHLLEAPAGWLGESRWRWRGWRFSRTPVRNQAELDEWVGVAAQPPVAWGANQYLLSGFGPARAVSVSLASRSWLVLTASGLTLALGLAFLNAPRLRRPEALLAAGALLAVAAAWSPDLAILASQAAVAGAALVLVAAWLSRPDAARAGRPAATSLRGSSIIERRVGQSTRPTVLRPGSSRLSPPTTKTAPLPAPLTAPESNS